MVGKLGLIPALQAFGIIANPFFHLISISQYCLSLDSSLAQPLGPAQSLAKLQEVLLDQKRHRNLSLQGCKRWFLLVQAQKHRRFSPKKGYFFFLLFLCSVPPCLCVME